MNKVKLLLASYNGEKYIVDQVQSILDQQKVEVDILVSDDASSDETVSILLDHFPDISVKVNNPSTGSAARNFIKMVCELDFTNDFNYLAFSDQDDFWLPLKMSRAIERLCENKASLYCSNLTKWDMETGGFTLLKKDYLQQSFDYLFEGGSAGCTYVLTKNFAEHLQHFLKGANLDNWPELSHDWLIYFYARSRGYKVYIDRESNIHYRIHASNVHGHLNKLSLRTILDKSRQVLAGYYQNQVRHYIDFLERDSESYRIYHRFMANYFRRNLVIWQYGTKLMRDRKKFLTFLILNLVRFR